MRRSLAMAVVCCALGAGIAQAREFPYTAVVIADEAYARSGPGTGYYETLRLHKDDTVLVERHDPGGWFAIAPPAGSFSWVKQSEVEKEASGVGTIVGHNVEARVGSLKAVHKSFHQVRLSKGAQVKILDERQTQAGKWYRIAPPTGELRWISGRDVVAQEELQQSTSQRAAADSPRESETQPYAPQEARPYSPEPQQISPVADEQESRDRNWRAGRGESQEEYDASVPTRRFVAKPSVPRRALPLARQETTGRQPAVTRKHATGEVAPETEAPEAQFDPSPMLIAEANREFVAMIRKDIALWDFSGIRQRFEEARSRATTPSGRAGASARLDHLARYERIKANHDGFRSTMARSRYRDRAVQAAYQREREVRSEQRPRYDGTGVLRRAPFQGAGTPRYVLADAQGNVRYYVVPGAGIDLHSYLDRTVAVYGTQSYRSDLLAHQITVRHVVSIEPLERTDNLSRRRVY